MASPVQRNLFFGQVGEAVAARVRPAEEVELDAARFVFEHEGGFLEGLLGRLGGR